MKRDIQNKDDIILLVNTFYDSIKQNKILGYIFTDVAKVDWDTHLPKMYSFWESILLDSHSYNGNPMVKHIALSKITSITDVEFSEWMSVFTIAVDELFEGEKANEAKLRAGNIARLMLHKIQTV
jgi:hemoglobin